jgi:hypothetical protein
MNDGIGDSAKSHAWQLHRHRPGVNNAIGIAVVSGLRVDIKCPQSLAYNRVVRSQRKIETPNIRPASKVIRLNKALIIVVFFAAIRSVALADTVILMPAKDNTLYEDGAGSLSNGSGIYLFAGKTQAPSLRRGLIAFDFASIPSNATITGATLSMFLSKTHGGPAVVSLNKALRAWGEGASNAGEPGGAGVAAQPGDATWFHTFYDTSFWVAHGGDFSSTVSASATVGTVNTTYTWSGSGLIADVQAWVSNPASNFGWGILGTETTGKAERFNTRENPSNPPKLTVIYQAPSATPTATPTATATATPAPTATPTATPAATPTPTAIPTATPTPAATPTPTSTATPAPTPTPTATSTPAPINISGTMSYCSNPIPGPVPNVTLTLTGDASGSTLSDGSGNYQFSSLTAGGSYIVTPTKGALTPAAAGINTVDVIATQRHFLNIAPLPPGCRLTAADVNGDTAINTVDVIAIQRFFLGQSTGIANTGKYQFSPASRAYPGVVNDQTGQNYDTLVFGDVAPSFVEP